MNLLHIHLKVDVIGIYQIFDNFFFFCHFKRKIQHTTRVL